MILIYLLLPGLMDNSALQTKITGAHAVKTFLLLAGLAFLYLAVRELNFRLEFLKHSTKTYGKVISVEQKQLFCARSGSAQCRPYEHPEQYGWAAISVLYTDTQGKEVVGTTGSVFHNFFPGIEHVSLYVSDTSPDEILVAHPLAYWLNFLILVFLGIAVIVGAFTRNIWIAKPRI